MRKKILFVATTAKSHIDIFHLPHIDFFKKNNWLVHVATNGDEKINLADKEFNINISRNPFNIKNLLGIFDLIKIMRNEKYDLISCHTPMGSVIARIAAYFSNIKPVIYIAHGFHFYKGAPFINNIYYLIEKFLANITDVIITMNQEDFLAAKKFCLRNNGKVYKIPGIGLDTKKILDAKYKYKNKDIKSELGIDENKIIALNIAEMIKRKNQAVILKAFAKIKSDNIILLICGRGKLEKKLKALAKKLNLDNNKIKFLGFRKDINKILAISDIFIFSSVQEGLPLALIEAMTAGLGIICSDIRGNKDLIKNNINGFLVKPYDINSYAKKIDLLANNKNLRQEFKIKNSELIYKYDINNIINILKKIYETLGFDFN